MAPFNGTGPGPERNGTGLHRIREPRFEVLGGMFLLSFGLLVLGQELASTNTPQGLAELHALPGSSALYRVLPAEPGKAAPLTAVRMTVKSGEMINGRDTTVWVLDLHRKADTETVVRVTTDRSTL